MRELSDHQLDILLILSDEKGHALHDLESRLKKARSNLEKKQYIGGLLAMDDGRSWESLSLDISDIKDPIGLANKLHESTDLLSNYIRDQLPKQLKSFLENFDAKKTQIGYKSKELYSLAFYLDAILKKQHLFNEQLFADVQLTSETRKLIEQIPNGAKPLLLNRLLLEEAYPNEIERSKKSIIYKGPRRKTTRKGSKRPNMEEDPYYINNDLKIFELILYNLIDRKNLARLDLNRIEERYNKEENRFAIENSDGKLENSVYEDTLYKEKNMDFYRDEFDKHENRLHEFMCSQYTCNLARKFGIPIIGGYLEIDIENVIGNYIQDVYLEMAIAKEIQEKGFISKNECESHISVLKGKMAPYSAILEDKTHVSFEGLKEILGFNEPL